MNRGWESYCTDRESLRKVLRYANEHPGIEAIIQKAVDSALRVFPDASIEVGLYEDPECPDSYVEVIVRLSEYPKDVVMSLESAQEAIYDDLCKTDGWVQITTDFRPGGRS